jgi:hypothetical protein
VFGSYGDSALNLAWDFDPFDMKFIGGVATRIINELKGIAVTVHLIWFTSRVK